MAQGKFLVLYGINHNLKVAVGKQIVEFLKQKGIEANFIKYPIYTVAPSGFFIEKALKGQQTMSEEELQLWFVLNRYQYQPVVLKNLKEGKWVVAEDYIWTGVAWGGAKGADRNWIAKINEPLLKEDISVLIDSKQFAGAEVTTGYANYDITEKVRLRLQEFAKEHGWHTVDGNRPAQEIFLDLIKVIEEKMG
ncbi:MAG: hypothetical protein HY362_03650 [Candidatus Aenigmarchaeota archaeon]|nr:hypothetical protein [Candidatus Aenigmarchaeota archaeon]